MSTIRSLDLFSLPELFKTIERDSKSGRLMVEAPISHDTAKRKGIYYVWFKNGYSIAISDCLNQKGLIDRIARREWLSPAIISRLRKLCPTGMPLGVYLRKMKLLDSEKLNLVFQLQLHQVYSLFQMDGGRFRFDDFDELQDCIVTIPWLEMTGHQISASEVCMYALRLMENSEKFVGQLPMPNQTLSRIIPQPHLKLTKIERQLWNMADGNTSLSRIAKISDLPVLVVQTTAFRLIAVGLIDSTPQTHHNWSSESNFSQTIDRTTKSFAQIGSSLIGNKQRDREQAYSLEQTSLLANLGRLFIKKNI